MQENKDKPVSADLLTLVLASQSPRRKELLGWLKIPFLVMSADLEEVSHEQRPALVAEDLARQKGEAIYQLCQKKSDFSQSFFPLIVSSDTLVALGDKIFNKPADKKEAAAMLDELKGRTHTVHTGVSLMMLDPKTKTKKTSSFCVSTEVTFKKMSNDIRDLYVDTGDSLDKAGAYGIQGMGLTFVESLEGSYSNVVGFPLVEFIDHLKTFLGHENDEFGLWRDLFLQTPGNESR